MDALLYAAQAVDPLGVPYGPIKVGETSDWPRRQAEIRAWLPSGHDVARLFSIPGSKAGVQLLESRLHWQLDHHCIAPAEAPGGSREWFADCPEVRRVLTTTHQLHTFQRAS